MQKLLGAWQEKGQRMHEKEPFQQKKERNPFSFSKWQH